MSLRFIDRDGRHQWIIKNDAKVYFNEPAHGRCNIYEETSMTKAEIIKYLYDNHVKADITFEEMADDLSVNPVPSISSENHDKIKSNTKDTIYRQAAIEAIHEMPPKLFSAYQHNAYIDKQDALVRIMALPPALSDIPDINEIINAIENAINTLTGDEAYMIGARNGLRWCWSALTNKNIEFEDIPSTQPEQGKGYDERYKRI